MQTQNIHISFESEPLKSEHLIFHRLVVHIVDIRTTISLRTVPLLEKATRLRLRFISPSLILSYIYLIVVVQCSIHTSCASSDVVPVRCFVLVLVPLLLILLLTTTYSVIVIATVATAHTIRALIHVGILTAVIAVCIVAVLLVLATLLMIIVVAWIWNQAAVITTLDGATVLINLWWWWERISWWCEVRRRWSTPLRHQW